jgi:hypothetical protein
MLVGEAQQRELISRVRKPDALPKYTKMGIFVWPEMGVGLS